MADISARRRLEWSARARRNLLSINTFYSQFGAAIAHRVTGAIVEAAIILQANNGVRTMHEQWGPRTMGSGLANCIKVSTEDAASAPSNWALTNALLSEHLSGSDTEALGRDLGCRYGLGGSLAGLALTPVQGILSSGQFGSAPQTLQPLSGLQEGLVKLG